MKYLLLIIWMLITLILVCTVIGMLLFIPKDRYENSDDVPSTWMTIGYTLLKSVIK